MEELKPKGIIQQQGSGQVTIIVQVPGEVVMFNVTEQELDSLASGFSPIHLAFFGMTLGALISFLITILTVPLSDRMFAMFSALLASSIIAVFYFGIRTAADIRANATRLKHIKERRRWTR